MAAIRFDNAPSEEYDDCFDACGKQCRLTVRSQRKPTVRLFDSSEHPNAVRDGFMSAPYTTGGPRTMVRHSSAPSAQAARFAAGSVAGVARTAVFTDAPAWGEGSNRADPLATPEYMRANSAYWPKNNQYASGSARSGSRLSMAMGRDWPQ